MRVVSAGEIDRAFGDGTELIDALSAAFRGRHHAPERHHHAIDREGEHATLLLMPAWGGDGGFAGVKVVSVFPGNAGRGLPSVQGTYLLLDGGTGVPLAAMDGTRLTLWRTAAASALASRHLSRPDARRMAMVGAGALAPFLIRAHRSVRPIADIRIWNRDPGRAAALAGQLAAEGISAAAATGLEEAVSGADLVSCATLSEAPLVHGAWLRPGAHLDLVGAFTPAMREADDAALQRAAIFVDTPGALHEGGDVAAALASGAIARAAIRGDLADLVAGRHPGRPDAAAVTLFKSVGASIEDLAAATLVWRSLRA